MHVFTFVTMVATRTLKGNNTPQMSALSPPYSVFKIMQETSQGEKRAGGWLCSESRDTEALVILTQTKP